MFTVTADEIAADPAGWLRRVEAGEAMGVTRDGRPIAFVTPVPPPQPLPPRQSEPPWPPTFPMPLPPRPADLPTGPRPFGLCKGEFVVPDDFDAPMSEDELKLWYGE